MKHLSRLIVFALFVLALLLPAGADTQVSRDAKTWQSADSHTAYVTVRPPNGGNFQPGEKQYVYFSFSNSLGGSQLRITTTANGYGASIYQSFGVWNGKSWDWSDWQGDAKGNAGAAITTSAPARMGYVAVQIQIATPTASLQVTQTWSNYNGTGGSYSGGTSSGGSAGGYSNNQNNDRQNTDSGTARVVEVSGKYNASLFIRASTDGTVVGVVPPGARLQVLQTMTVNGVVWYRVTGTKGGTVMTVDGRFVRDGWIRSSIVRVVE